MFKEFPFAEKVDDKHVLFTKCWSVSLMGIVVILMTAQKPEDSNQLKSTYFKKKLVILRDCVEGNILT